jgi:CubicO group peptidase (beta-lactamase class C family)
MAILRAHNVSLDDPIGPYFPSDGEAPQYLQRLTFAQPLTHTSGIKDLGNGPQPYDRLQTFFTQTVQANSTTPCRKVLSGGPGMWGLRKGASGGLR